MAEQLKYDDPLSRWLQGEGLATLDALTAHSLDIIAVLDPELHVRYINWTGPSVSREDTIGKNVIDLTPPDYREVARETYAQVLETGTGTRFESIYRAGDRVAIWDVRVGPIKLGGEVVGLIAITDDVTEQRRAAADRDRFFSLSLDMLIVANPEGILTRVNPAFGEVLGYKVSQLVGRPFIDFVHPDDRAMSNETYQGVLGGARIKDFENRYRRSDGSYRVFSWRATVDPVTGDVYAVARDITDHRATETQLRHAQKMEAVGQLAGGIAHDFNNLMQAILANTELAMASNPGQVPEYLGDIDSAGHRAAELTKQLLAFSRQQALRPVPTNPNALIRGLMKMLRRLLPENIAIDFIPGHKIASVSADPTQLEQVIVNLCVNARDAMVHGGQLTIETENVLVNGRYCESHPWAKPGRYVLLTVTDTGTGMLPEIRERAFEPFFSTKGTQGGTGLGLSMVYGIVRQHDGMVHLYSEQGEGTTFKIYLPADSRLATDVGTKIEALPKGGGETILLAEDEERVRRVVVKILERAGYNTIVASNGLEAVKLLREQTEPVHLVLLDVVMPELGGPETWERIQNMRPGLRVLFTSGYADGRYLERLPADAELIEKPFRTEELLKRIREKLDA